MGEVKEADWYNQLKPWQKPVRYREPWPTMSSWYQRHYQVAEVISTFPKEQPVLDLGCGLGTLAAVAWHEFNHRGPWVGVDFAPWLLRNARKQNAKIGHQHSAWIQWDFRDEPMVPEHHMILDGKYSKLQTLTIITEVLEHIDGDLELLKRVPQGEVLISVPLEDAPAHVRNFPKMEEAVERYSEVLVDVVGRELATIAQGEGSKVHSWLLRGKKR